MILTHLWKEALTENGIGSHYVEYLSLSREETQQLIRENSHKADLIIPRGGEGLIRLVQEHATVPVIISGRGNNFIYIDKDVDFKMAIRLVINGKKRISVCNAIDKVLINRELPNLSEKVGQLVNGLEEKGITILGNSEIATLSQKIVKHENDNILYEEFLAPKIYLSLIDGIDRAVDMINHYSGGHTAVIVTNIITNAEYFMQEVDCAAVYHNASSRFTDGGQFGVGGEIAISTQKLHFRGPLGAKNL